MDDFDTTRTAYGFDWGPMRISKLASHDRMGVLLGIETDDCSMTVRSSPKGTKLQVLEPHNVDGVIPSDVIDDSLEALQAFKAKLDRFLAAHDFYLVSEGDDEAAAKAHRLRDELCDFFLDQLTAAAIPTEATDE